MKEKDLSTIIESVERHMANVFIIAEQARLPLQNILSHQVTFLLHFVCLLQNSPEPKALIIDGGSILEIRRTGKALTVRQYAT